MAEHEPAQQAASPKSQAKATEELSEEELDQVAGGVLPYIEQENVTAKAQMQDLH
jgi:bacteriocin-like protein